MRVTQQWGRDIGLLILVCSTSQLWYSIQCHQMQTRARNQLYQPTERRRFVWVQINPSSKFIYARWYYQSSGSRYPSYGAVTRTLSVKNVPNLTTFNSTEKCQNGKGLEFTESKNECREDQSTRGNGVLQFGKPGFIYVGVSSDACMP